MAGGKGDTTIKKVSKGSRELSKIGKGDTLVWQSVNPPAIDFITSQPYTIDLDSRATGTIELDYKAAGDSYNEIHNQTDGHRNIPILPNLKIEQRDTSIGSGLWFGAFSNGTTIWVTNASTNYALAFTKLWGVDSSNNINLGRAIGSTPGAWRNGIFADNTFWFLNGNNLFAWDGSRRLNAHKNIELGGSNWERVFTDGTTIWVIDNTANYARAWNVSDRARNTSMDFALGSGAWYGAAVSDRAVYLLDGSSSAPTIKAFTLQDKQRRPDKDFALPTSNNPSFRAYRGLAFADNQLYVIDDNNNKGTLVSLFEKTIRNEVDLGVNAYKTNSTALDTGGSNVGNGVSLMGGNLLFGATRLTQDIVDSTFDGDIIELTKTAGTSIGLKSSYIVKGNISQASTGHWIVPIDLDAIINPLSTTADETYAVRLVHFGTNFVPLPSRNFSLGAGSWQGAASDGRTFYILDRGTIKAWNATTLIRDNTIDHTISGDIGSTTAKGLVISGTSLWVITSGVLAIAYTIGSSGALTRHIGGDITHGSTTMERGFSTGTDIWFINNTTHTAVSFDIGARTASNKNIGLGSGNWEGGAVVVGNFAYITNRNDNRVHCHNLNSRGRDTAKEFVYANIGDVELRGMMAVGHRVWFIDNRANTASCRWLNASNTGAFIVPQPNYDTEYILNSHSTTGASSQSFTLEVSKDLAITNFRRTSFAQTHTTGQRGVYGFAFNVTGTPMPNSVVFSGGHSHTTDGRHFVRNGLNSWSFAIDFNLPINPNRPLTVTVTNGRSTASATINNINS